MLRFKEKEIKKYFRIFLGFCTCFSWFYYFSIVHAAVINKLPKSWIFHSTTVSRAYCQNHVLTTPALPRWGQIALETYITNSDVVNPFLIDNDPLTLTSPLVHNMDLALRWLPSIPSHLTLYRVESRSQEFISNLKVGQVLTWESYLSSSKNPNFFDVAKKYPFYSPNTNVQYVIKKHQNGKFISPFSPNRNKEGPEEIQEITFPRGTQFMISKIIYNYGIPLITLEEVQSNNGWQDPAQINENDFKMLHENFF